MARSCNVATLELRDDKHAGETLAIRVTMTKTRAGRGVRPAPVIDSSRELTNSHPCSLCSSSSPSITSGLLS